MGNGRWPMTAGRKNIETPLGDGRYGRWAMGDDMHRMTGDSDIALLRTYISRPMADGRNMMAVAVDRRINYCIYQVRCGDNTRRARSLMNTGNFYKLLTRI
jgi:hypothetical protein